MIELEHVNKAFGPRILFEDFNLKIADGEGIAITGPSGRGKTTLLNMMGMLEPPDSGVVRIDGHENPRFNSREGRQLLRGHVSFLLQNYGLVEDRTVEYNMRIVTDLLGRSKKERDDVIASALEQVGLPGYQKAKVYQLSGGEQQRVALARVIAKGSDLILADEPTGNLDRGNAENVISILKRLNGQGKTVVVVTHDSEVSEALPRQLACRRAFSFSGAPCKCALLAPVPPSASISHAPACRFLRRTLKTLKIPAIALGRAL